MAAPSASDDIIGLALAVSQQAFQIRQLQAALDKAAEQLQEARRGERSEGEPGV